MIALVFALLIVSTQALRAAHANPANSFEGMIRISYNNFSFISICHEENVWHLVDVGLCHLRKK